MTRRPVSVSVLGHRKLPPFTRDIFIAQHSEGNVSGLAFRLAPRIRWTVFGTSELCLVRHLSAALRLSSGAP